MKSNRSIKFVLVFSLLIFCLIFFVSPRAGADQSESDSTGLLFVQSPEGKQSSGQKEGEYSGNNEKIFNPFNMLVSLPQKQGISLTDKKIFSPLREVRISLNERLKVFLSLGAPALRDLAGKQIKTDYRALFGFHIAF